ncbi:glycosyltransferase [Pseudonocardia halophobica]|uniref:glycosyltransferase n=1 Tax=Pseudonocardia halophobica TaxID=29401 RepID=UPI003D8AED2F
MTVLAPPITSSSPTGTGGTVPSVRLVVGPAAAPLGTATVDALRVLVGAGRARWAEPGEPADLLHTVGDLEEMMPTPTGATVHSVDRIPLRGRELIASRTWTRRQRGLAGTRAAWLTHGRDASRLVVRTGLVAGERVYCLPVLPPCAPTPTLERARVRHELGLRPGVRLVVGHSGRSTAHWDAAIDRLHRDDLAVLHLAAQPGCIERTGGSPRPWPLPDLLVAADLFVAAGNELTAVNPAACALAMGVPVVAVTTDSAADLLTPGRDGHVVAPAASAIAHAVSAHLDHVPRPRGPVRPTDHEGAALRLARSLLQVYRQVLAMPQGLWRRR